MVAATLRGEVVEGREAMLLDRLARLIQARLARDTDRQLARLTVSVESARHQRDDEPVVDETSYEVDDPLTVAADALARGGRDELARVIRAEQLSDKADVEQRIRNNWVRDRKSRGQHG